MRVASAAVVAARVNVVAGTTVADIAAVAVESTAAADIAVDVGDAAAAAAEVGGLYCHVFHSFRLHDLLIPSSLRHLAPPGHFRNSALDQWFGHGYLRSPPCFHPVHLRREQETPPDLLNEILDRQ